MNRPKEIEILSDRVLDLIAPVDEYVAIREKQHIERIEKQLSYMDKSFFYNEKLQEDI